VGLPEFLIPAIVFVVISHPGFVRLLMLTTAAEHCACAN